MKKGKKHRYTSLSSVESKPIEDLISQTSSTPFSSSLITFWMFLHFFLNNSSYDEEQRLWSSSSFPCFSALRFHSFFSTSSSLRDHTDADGDRQPNTLCTRALKLSSSMPYHFLLPALALGYLLYIICLPPPSIRCLPNL